MCDGQWVGILLTGKIVPVLNAMAAGWRVSWIVFGCLIGCIALLCFLLFRNNPKDGGAGMSNTKLKPNATMVGTGVNSSSGQRSTGKKIFYYCATLYFLFGFTFAITSSFFL